MSDQETQGTIHTHRIVQNPGGLAVEARVFVPSSQHTPKLAADASELAAMHAARLMNAVEKSTETPPF